MEENNIEEYLESWSTIPGIFLSSRHMFVIESHKSAIKTEKTSKKYKNEILLDFL